MVSCVGKNNTVRKRVKIAKRHGLEGPGLKTERDKKLWL